MEYIIENGISYPRFQVIRTSKNTYRIIEHGNKHTVVHSMKAVMEFMDVHNISGFEVDDLRKVVD